MKEFKDWLNKQPLHIDTLNVSGHEVDATPRSSALIFDGSDADSPARSSGAPSDGPADGVIMEHELVLPESIPPFGLDLLKSTDPCSITHDQSQMGMTHPELDIWSSVHEFFNTAYVIFPIVSFADVAARLVETPNWFAVPDLRTLLLSLRLLNAAAQYRIDAKDENHIQNLI